MYTDETELRSFYMAPLFTHKFYQIQGSLTIAYIFYCQGQIPCQISARVPKPS